MTGYRYERHIPWHRVRDYRAETFATRDETSGDASALRAAAENAIRVLHSARRRSLLLTADEIIDAISGLEEALGRSPAAEAIKRLERMSK